jgi:glycosyltransferase involved in cell wall biosynthesis
MRGEAKAIKIKDPWSLIIRLQIPVSVSIERKLLANAHTVTAVAQSVANELASQNRYKKPVKVLGNGVDISVFHPAEQNSVQADKAYILAAGRLDVRKGFHNLIEAMVHISRRFSFVQLYIAGTGPLEGQLQTQIERLRLGRVVRLLGQIDQPKLAKLYQGATIFAHAAHYEGLPTVLLEAMASGKAVVCTSVSGALDVIENDVNGILVPPKRPARLAEAICNLLDDRESQKRLGSAARRTVEKRFSWQVVGSNYLHCYESLLAGKKV